MIDQSTGVTYATLRECCRFKVTSNPGEEMLTALQFTCEDIRSLPPHSTILDIGSGTFQENSATLREINPCLTVCSFDPTLAIAQIGEDLFHASGRVFTAEAISAYNLSGGLVYAEQGVGQENNPFLRRQATMMHRMRMKDAQRNGGIAGLIDRLPFCKDSFDLVIETFGPWTIFCNTERDRLAYLKEIHRILKPGGEARIFPAESIVLYGNYLQQEYDSMRQEQTKALIDKALIGSGFDPHYFTHEVTSYEPHLRKDLTNNRLGVILKKCW